VIPEITDETIKGTMIILRRFRNSDPTSAENETTPFANPSLCPPLAARFLKMRPVIVARIRELRICQ
jgi:hypothetical protein